jgi:hypothetical protein
MWPADQRELSDTIARCGQVRLFVHIRQRLHDVVKSIRCVNNLTRAGEKMADQ